MGAAASRSAREALHGLSPPLLAVAAAAAASRRQREALHGPSPPLLAAAAASAASSRRQREAWRGLSPGTMRRSSSRMTSRSSSTRIAATGVHMVAISEFTPAAKDALGKRARHLPVDTRPHPVLDARSYIKYEFLLKK